MKQLKADVRKKKRDQFRSINEGILFPFHVEAIIRWIVIRCSKSDIFEIGENERKRKANLK
jgi:hypothetical protein